MSTLGKLSAQCVSLCFTTTDAALHVMHAPHLPSPMRSPQNSMGALSFSPSPITTTPSNEMLPKTVRIASTAAPSAASFWPLPSQCAAASAAASVTRTCKHVHVRSNQRARPRRPALCQRQCAAASAAASVTRTCNTCASEMDSAHSKVYHCKLRASRTHQFECEITMYGRVVGSSGCAGSRGWCASPRHAGAPAQARGDCARLAALAAQARRRRTPQRAGVRRREHAPGRPAEVAGSGGGRARSRRVVRSRALPSQRAAPLGTNTQVSLPARTHHDTGCARGT